MPLTTGKLPIASTPETDPRPLPYQLSPYCVPGHGATMANVAHTAPALKGDRPRNRSFQHSVERWTSYLGTWTRRI